jgi:starch synthase
MKPLRVLSVVSEIYPIIKTGGLADVAGALPIALQKEGVEVRTLLPGYPAVLNALDQGTQIFEWQSFFGGAIRVFAGSCSALKLFVLDAPHLYGRPGNPYLAPDGVDWPDNAIRFAALARVAANIGQGSIHWFEPDVVHCHDWQTALAPAYLYYSGRPRPKTVMTIHNLAFQGRFSRRIMGDIGLPDDAFNMYGVEYYGDIGFLKAGLQFSDVITTVSPTYAVEIQNDEQGMGLGGLLRTRSGQLRGILNGIDTDVWNPSTDPTIARRFSPGGLSDRVANRAALRQRLGLVHEADTLLLGVISRLSWQKGLDLLLESIPALINEGTQLVLLGAGNVDLQDGFQAMAKAHPMQIGVSIGYDENLAHLIQAGCDALVVPSRFEPCGLTQLCALRYGAIPIVSRVGGLEDTVVDIDEATGKPATGLKFEPVTAQALAGCLRRARALYQDKPRWRGLQNNGMSTDVSWQNRASQYANLYREITAA